MYCRQSTAEKSFFVKRDGHEMVLTSPTGTPPAKGQLEGEASKVNLLFGRDGKPLRNSEVATPRGVITTMDPIPPHEGRGRATDEDQASTSTDIEGGRDSREREGSGRKERDGAEKVEPVFAGKA